MCVIADVRAIYVLLTIASSLLADSVVHVVNSNFSMSIVYFHSIVVVYEVQSDWHYQM